VQVHTCTADVAKGHLNRFRLLVSPGLQDLSWYLPTYVTLPKTDRNVSNDRIVAQQGCQMVCFLTKNPNLGKIWRAFEL
jgi:hypothetical protein